MRNEFHADGISRLAFELQIASEPLSTNQTPLWTSIPNYTQRLTWQSLVSDHPLRA
jgi:hypothetical protein